jgi:hypothetical protein
MPRLILRKARLDINIAPDLELTALLLAVH